MSMSVRRLLKQLNKQVDQTTNNNKQQQENYILYIHICCTEARTVSWEMLTEYS